MKAAFAQVAALFDGTGDRILPYDQIQRWVKGAFDACVAAKLIRPTSPASTLRCDNCDHRCVVEPIERSCADGQSAFGFYCLENSYGFLGSSPHRLSRWTGDETAMARWVARQLDLDSVPLLHRPGLWLLGYYFGRPLVLALRMQRSDDRDHVEKYLAHLGRRAVLLTLRPICIPFTHDGEVYALLDLTSADRLELVAATLLQHLREGTRGRSGLEPIPVPAGTRWEKIVIRVIDDESLEIILGGKTFSKHYTQLGMVNRRERIDRPRETWRTLLDLADSERGRNRPPAPTPEWRARIAALRKTLRAIFGQSDDPFHDYRSEHGWRPRFILTDQRHLPK